MTTDRTRSRTIAAATRTETVVKKSRFICSLGRVTDETEARAFVAAGKAEFWDASHNCSAWVIGSRGELQRSNDDGEPAGTAGNPMLSALNKRELTDTVAVVTRYFGGTLLGASGLIRAYGHAVTDAIDEAGIVERIPLQVVLVRADHDIAGKVDHALRSSEYALVEVDYGEQASFRLLLAESEVPVFSEWIAELTSGRSGATIAGVEIVEVPVSAAR